MKIRPGTILFFLILAVIFSAGCINPAAQAPPAPAPAFTTPIPVPAVPVATVPVVTTSSVISTIPPVTQTQTFVPKTTLTPRADPVDVSEITFLHYSDGDFSMDYPSTWTPVTSYSTPYPIGPFFLFDDPRLNPPYRVVTFTSPDSTKKIVALTQDFERAGIYVLNPTIDWGKAMFERNYPDLSPANYLGNYKYFSGGNTMASSYDVLLPKGSGYYPSAYSVKTVITVRRVHNFGFFTDTENFQKYQNLKEKIFASIKINDAG
jgi:hypothetical protein